MAAITGIEGAVTSWAGTQNSHLISSGTKPADFTLRIEAGEHDVTGFGDAGIAAMIKETVYQWSGTIRAQLVAPASGTLGLVTFAAGYTANLNAWDMAVECAASNPATSFGNTAHVFLPTVMRWGGSFSGSLDGTTALLIPAASSSEPGSATFKYQERGADDNALSGDVFTTRVEASVPHASLATVSYTYRGTGALTQSTPSTGAGIFPAGAIARPTAGSLVLTAATGRTYTGSAFWTRVALGVSLGQAVSVDIDFQGTGPLVIA